MTYSANYPVRLFGGRLALDFVNTADWSADGDVVHEKIATPADVAVWADAVGLDTALLPDSVGGLLALRSDLRAAFIDAHEGRDTGGFPILRRGPAIRALEDVRQQSLADLIAASAISILADRRELGRLKICPGENCGWLFIDETRNARRKWCSMETCGNRAKAARHYERTKTGAA